MYAHRQSKVKATPAQVKSRSLDVAHSWLSRAAIYFVHQFKPSFNEHALLDDPEMLAAVTAVNRQIRELARRSLQQPLGCGLRPSVRSSDPQTPIDILVKRTPEAAYVFAVSMRNGRAAARSRSRSCSKLAAPAEVLGEDRKITIRGREFDDAFPAFGVHLYRIAAGGDASAARK